MTIDGGGIFGSSLDRVYFLPNAPVHVAVDAHGCLYLARPFM